MAMKKKRVASDREECVYRSALRRGAGECFTMLSTDGARRKFRPLVKWACARDLAYDAQVEGSRALYLYELIGRYPDAEEFFDLVEKKFFSSIGKAGRHWLFVQECELLAFFSDDGCDRAKRSLERGYETLYGRLRRMRPEKMGFRNPEVDNFRALCDQLIRGANASASRSWLSRIVVDVGRLCLHDSFWNDLPVEIELSARYARGVGERGLAAVLRRIDSSDEAKAYRAAVARTDDERRRRRVRSVLGYRAVYNRLRAGETSEMRFMVRKWRADGRTKDIKGLASMYQREEDTEMRASLLEMFSTSMPSESFLSIDDLLRDAAAKDERLSRAALDVLGKIRDPRVHDMALEKMAAEGVSYEVFKVLARNYREEDDATLISAARKLGDMRQDALTVLAGLVGRGSGVAFSNRMLLFLYGAVQCSHCRETCVLEMGRRGLLTDEMLDNCLHDANDDIRRYASRLLKRRRKS